LNKNTENVRKKNQTEILEIIRPYSQTTNQSGRLEQVEDRLSELENKIEIKEKREEIISSKSCERNMQELSNSIKRPNMRIMGI
jgi:hypothetical protein